MAVIWLCKSKYLKKSCQDVLCCWCVSFLLGSREEVRPGEIVAKVIFKPITWAFPTLISIPVSTVARAVVNKTVALATDKFEILENKAIHLAAAG